MEAVLSAQASKLKETKYYLPEVSVILPFEPKMTSRSIIKSLLIKAADKVERDLIENYPNDLGIIVINKLRQIFDNLNYGTHKKSIAIYISPVFENILYLDIPVQELINVADSFCIRSIVNSKQKSREYNVLLLGEKSYSIYNCNNTFQRVIFNTSNIFNVNYKQPKLLADFPVIFPSFLRYMDLSLNRFLAAYPAPLFVVGTKKIIAQFKKITTNNLKVNQYIAESHETMSTSALQQLLQPLVSNWAIVKKQYLLNKMKNAVQSNSLVFGIRDVWEQIVQNNGRLLLLQNDYNYLPEPGSGEDIINNATQPFSNFSYIKNAVDFVIEKVFRNGGDVEFVEEEFLKDIGPIALIK